MNGQYAEKRKAMSEAKAMAVIYRMTKEIP